MTDECTCAKCDEPTAEDFERLATIIIERGADCVSWSVDASWQDNERIVLIALREAAERRKSAREREPIDELWKVAWAAKEFIDDWRKGDFSLSTLAALDAQSLDEALTRLYETQAHRREREPVKVKPLEWTPTEEWKKCSRERAPAFGGEYQIVMLDPGEGELPSLYFEIGLGSFMFRFEQDQDPMGLPGETCPKKFPSISAAKAAAQADYEARIRAALVDGGGNG